MSECYCNEGGLCNNCYDAKCDENNKLTKKVERLENAIWAYLYDDHEMEPEAIKTIINDIYTGKLDDYFDKVLKDVRKGEDCE